MYFKKSSFMYIILNKAVFFISRYPDIHSRKISFKMVKTYIFLNSANYIKKIFIFIPLFKELKIN